MGAGYWGILNSVFRIQNLNGGVDGTQIAKPLNLLALLAPPLGKIST